MRKNLLIAALVGTCVIGVTACSKGEENKSTNESTPSTAMTQPEQNPADQTQAAPAQSADNSSAQPAPIQQPEGQSVVADSNAQATPDAQTSAPMPTDNNAGNMGSDSSSGMTPTDNSANMGSPTDSSSTGSSTDNSMNSGSTDTTK